MLLLGPCSFEMGRKNERRKTKFGWRNAEKTDKRDGKNHPRVRLIEPKKRMGEQKTRISMIFITERSAYYRTKGEDYFSSYSQFENLEVFKRTNTCCYCYCCCCLLAEFPLPDNSRHELGVRVYVYDHVKPSSSFLFNSPGFHFHDLHLNRPFYSQHVQSHSYILGK